MTIDKCATCHNMRATKMNNHNRIYIYIYIYMKMHKLWHVAKINFATCINIKTSIMDDGY